MEEHDNTVLDCINSKVARADRLIISGDFAFCKVSQYRQKIKCKHIDFVLGNHDKPQAIKNAFGSYEKIREIKTTLLGKVVVCHYPIIYWPRSHHGSIHLYGHTHDKAEIILDTIFPDRRSMDIGVDSAIRILGTPSPFSEEEVYELLKDRTGHHKVGSEEAVFLSSIGVFQ